MMFQISHKKLLQIRIKELSLGNFLQVLQCNSISHLSSSTNRSSYTVSYLINSCGLSAETALSTAKKFTIKKPANADLVLAFLTNHGFIKTKIRELVTQYPRTLSIKVEKTLQPKFQFLLEIGLSASQLTELIVANPSILRWSLEYKLVPYVNFLKSLLHNNENVIKALEQTSGRMFTNNLQTTVVPNVSLLQQHGIPSSVISRILMSRIGILLVKSDRLSESVKKAREMGFDPSLPAVFVQAIAAIGLKQSTWDAKSTVYRSLGWSEEEVLTTFQKQPICMSISVEKIRKGMAFFVNKLGLKPSDVASRPHLLFFSLEKRIIPRCTVLHTLASKNLIKKDLKLSKLYNLIRINEIEFLTRYVIEYQDEVPDLLNSNQGKIEVFELNIKT